MYVKYEAGKKTWGIVKRIIKRTRNLQMNMIGVSNWEVLRCREFTPETFVEMVLRHFFV